MVHVSGVIPRITDSFWRQVDRRTAGPIRKAARFSQGLLGALVIATAAWADPPQITPPVFVPGDVGTGLAASDQFEPVIVKGGDLFLAVWTDWRSKLAGYDTYGVRLDAQGSLMDAYPIPILLDGSGQIDPLVAWNGTNWLVVVEDEASPAGVEPRLRGVRVSPEGQVLDTEPIGIAPSGTGGSICALASDGSNWAVFWTGTAGGHGDVRAARISPDGVVLDPEGRVVLEETYFVRFYLDASYAGGRYLLAYNDSSRMSGLLLTSSLDPAGPGVSQSSQTPTPGPA